MKTKVLQLDKPKREWVETYQQLDILATITGHEDLWHKHYPFKKWITHKYFPEVDMDKDDFPDMDFCDQEIIQEWIDETNQDFILISMPDQKGFYFCEDEYKNYVELQEYNRDTGEFWSINKGKWISTD